MTAHYVYRCYDANSRLLYVGQSKDWTARLAQHRALRKSRSFWVDQVVHVRVAVHRSPEAARAAERVAIREENPRFNFQGRWETRDNWTREDWVDFLRASIAAGRNSVASLRSVFEGYVEAFGEALHPTMQAIRDEVAAADVKRAEERAREDIESRIRNEELAFADRLAMLEHFRTCPPCAAANEYADDCPELIAFDAQEARLDAERSERSAEVSS